MRPDDPLDSADSSSGTTLVELRSLPLAAAGRRGPAIGVGGTIAVLAIAGLLAAGFGVLGGRPSPSPSPPLGGLGPTAPGASPTSVAATPAVTPFSACGPAPTSVPEVLLQVNGRPTPGSIEILQWHIASPAPRSHGSPEEPPDLINIPVDVITELWIVGGACASAWEIGLIGNEVLNRFVNPELDPGLAAQNRFRLEMAPYGGRDLSLYADLFFPTLIARATWQIHVETFERPVAILQEAAPGAIVEGCYVELVLGNGYQFPIDQDCTSDLPYEPVETLEVERGERLEFGLGDWDVSNALLTCGHLSGTSFVAEPEPGCFLETTGRPTPSRTVTFPALPEHLELGAWTLAISACALSGGLAENSLCGTWYASVEVRD